MNPSTPSSSLPSSEPAPGLPPVLPPSGRFIAQLFVVPGLIVLFVVMLLVGFAYLANSQAGYTTNYFLQRLDNPNADIRWRAANELAQILNRPEQASLKWKADPRFALDLAERLQTAQEELMRKEEELQQRIATRSATEQEAAWQSLRSQRDHLLFLAAALSDFHIPVGAPLLCDLGLRDNSPDVKGNTLRRRQAVWALAKLGENTGGFRKLPAAEQAAIGETLRQEAAASTPRGRWARTALHYLGVDVAAEPDSVHVDEVLARLAESPDRFLRELVAYAFNFWPGPLAEPTLLRLAQDDGHGTLMKIDETDR
jgi:hypothetical protein